MQVPILFCTLMEKGDFKHIRRYMYTAGYTHGWIFFASKYISIIIVQQKIVLCPRTPRDYTQYTRRNSLGTLLIIKKNTHNDENLDSINFKSIMNFIKFYWKYKQKFSIDRIWIWLTEMHPINQSLSRP